MDMFSISSPPFLYYCINISYLKITYGFHYLFSF
nr:MAG TPA: hypothetical protein [Caudoviricetes sp.]